MDPFDDNSVELTNSFVNSILCADTGQSNRTPVASVATTLDNIMTNTESESDTCLRNLLDSWGFGHLFDLLKSEEITLERLGYINEKDLKELLQPYKLGVRIEFRRKLTDWKIHNKLTTLSTCDTITNLDEQSDREASLTPTSSDYSSTSTTKAWNSFDLLNAVKESPNGDYVIRVFQKTKRLDDASRKIIIDAVIGWHMQHSIKITRPIFESLASNIEERFNDNKHIYYNKTGNTPSGRLYDKYQNHTKRLRKLGILIPTQHRSENILDSTKPAKDNFTEYQDNNQDVENKLWLQLNNSPWSEVKTRWDR